jgi:excisionase family DNA binding protein
MTLREAAARLRVSERTLRRLIAIGAVPAVKVGSQIRLDPDELDQYIYGDPETVA